MPCIYASAHGTSHWNILIFGSRSRSARHNLARVINQFGLTACSGDSWRDTVENTPMLVCVHACGGTDGACHAANDLPGRLSRVCTDASLACPRPQSGTRRYAVSDGGPRRPCASLSRWPHGAHLVQLVSPPGMPAMRLSPNRALARPPAGAVAGL